MTQDKLIVAGLNGLDGEYDFSLISLLTIGSPDALTGREVHNLKVMTGIRMGELEDALSAGDNDVMLGLAAIVMRRHGRTFADDQVWDAPIGSFGFELAAVEDDAVPPPQPNDESSSESETSSGDDSNSDSENPENDQSPTGPPE